MTSLPCVTEARYRGGFRIHLTFNDNSEGTLDFRHWLEGPIFEPLKDPVQFRRFFLDGGTVAWPNGADIAPETLYEAARHEDSGSRSGQTHRRAPQRTTAVTPAKAVRTRVHH